MLKQIVCTIAVAVTLFSCSQKSQQMADDAFLHLIPKPVQAERLQGYFNVSGRIAINVADGNAQTLQVADMLIQTVKPVAQATLTTGTAAGFTSGILFVTVTDSTLGNEGYILHVTDSLITIKAQRPAGFFYAVQTIRQLLPPEQYNNTSHKSWLIAACSIKDYPLYALRGSMLDVSRHFFGVEDVKKYIDHLAAYKMNVFHMHLSDDQGWRIEIKKWPKLTEVGGSTQVGGGNGGFYTQEAYKDIVQYAAARFITVIPEIDMPGHTNAALASYPELNCNPKDSLPKLYTGTEVGFSSLCTTNEKVYGFIDDVIAELAAITPGPYIHIGGDESLVTPKEEYIKFMNRVQPIVTKYGKQVIGWDEIANAVLQPGTIAQHWADTLNPVKAIAQGAKVIMSPAKRVYLDMQYDSTTKLGLHWASYIEVEHSYSWNPATLVKGVEQKNIAGLVAPLWTETIVTRSDIEYMLFPRLLSYAEIGWSPVANRNWEEYKVRLAHHGLYLKAQGINFYQSKQVQWK